PDGWRAQKQSVDFVTHDIVPGKDISQSFVFVPTPTRRSIRIDCFGAIVSKREVLESVSDGPNVVSLQTYDELNPPTRIKETTLDYNNFRKYGVFFYIQIAENLAFRVVEKYYDRASNQFLDRIAAERLLVVTAIIECDWYASLDDQL